MKIKNSLLLPIIILSLFLIVGCTNNDIDYNEGLESQLTSLENNDNKEDILDKDKEDILDTDEEDEINPKDTKIDSKVVEVVVADKINIPADIDRFEFSDWVGLAVDITNFSDKNIKGIQGILDIQDLFGESILKLSYDLVGETIDAGSTVRNERMGISINEFIPEHNKIYNLDYTDLNFEYMVLKVVFEDGSIIEY